MARGQTKRAIHRPASRGDAVRETSGQQGTGIAFGGDAIADAQSAPMQAGGAANALHRAAIRRRVISARQQIKAQADIRRRFPPAQRVAFFQKGREFGEEGCLSFPGIHAEVERWIDITLTYQDLDGKEQNLAANGWLARIIQHEMDHLDGVFFVDRLTAGEKLRVKAKLLELEADFGAKA